MLFFIVFLQFTSYLRDDFDNNPQPEGDSHVYQYTDCRGVLLDRRKLHNLADQRHLTLKQLAKGPFCGPFCMRGGHLIRGVGKVGWSLAKGGPFNAFAPQNGAV